MTPLDRLADVAPVFVIFPIFYLMLKAYLEYRTRQKVIELKLVNEEIRHLFDKKVDAFLPGSLKWGLILILVGIAAVVMKIIDDVSGEMAFGVMLIAAGAGLLIYYFVGSLKAKEMNNNKL